MSKKSLYEALAARTSLEVVDDSEVSSGSQLRFMVRVAKGPSTTIWLGVVKHLLTIATKGAAWTLDISKQYFIGPAGDLRYGWRIIIKSTAGLSDSVLASIAAAVKEAPARSVQLEEVRLNGNPNRRVGALMGQAVVGPSAIRNS